MNYSKRSIIAAFIGLFTAGSVAASGSDHAEFNQEYAKKFYNQSEHTPLYLVFESYIQTVHDRLKVGEFEAIDYVVDTLHLGHTNEGEKRAKELVSIFTQTFENINEENLREKETVLCSGDPASKTAVELVRILNTMDDIGELIARKHQKITLSMIRAEERKSLISKLKSNRRSFFYMSIDYGYLFDRPLESVRYAVQNACWSLQNSAQYIQ